MQRSRKFVDGKATLYYTGRQFPTTIALRNLHFFMSYVKGRGMSDVYGDNRVRAITGKEAKGTGEDGDGGNDLRLAFELRFVRRLYPRMRPVNAGKFVNYTFLDTSFDRLEDALAAD